jgi:hypothetical protein
MPQIIDNTVVKTPKGTSRSCQSLEFSGAPKRIRTSDLRIRSPALYPAELWAHKINARSFNKLWLSKQG